MSHPRDILRNGESGDGRGCVECPLHGLRSGLDNARCELGLSRAAVQDAAATQEHRRSQPLAKIIINTRKVAFYPVMENLLIYRGEIITQNSFERESRRSFVLPHEAGSSDHVRETVKPVDACGDGLENGVNLLKPSRQSLSFVAGISGGAGECLEIV